MEKYIFTDDKYINKAEKLLKDISISYKLKNEKQNREKQDREKQNIHNNSKNSMFMYDNDIGNKDLLLFSIQKKLQELENTKKNHVHSIQENIENNALLKSILYDYKNKYSGIVSLKKKQQKQIHYLIQYLENSMKEAGITNSMLENIKVQKKSLIQEIKKIQNDIDNLLADTKSNLDYGDLEENDSDSDSDNDSDNNMGL